MSIGGVLRYSSYNIGTNRLLLVKFHIILSQFRVNDYSPSGGFAIEPEKNKKDLRTMVVSHIFHLEYSLTRCLFGLF